MRQIFYTAFAGVLMIMLAVPESAAEEHGEGVTMVMGDTEVGLSGDVAFGVFAIEHDDVDGTEYAAFNLKNGDSEIAASLNTITDDGVEVSGVMEITSEGDIDDVYVGMAGFFGEVYFGDLDGAAQQMHYAAPTTVPGDGIDNDPHFYHLERTSARTSLAIDYDDDANKLLYVSPRVAGLQVAASYTPSTDQNGNNGQGVSEDTPSSVAGEERSIKLMSLGVNYNVDLGPLPFGLSLGYLEGDAADNRKPKIISLGTRLVWGYLELGGSWYMDEDVIAEDLEQTGWSAGLTYGTDDWKIGGAYRESESEAELASGTVYDKESTAMEVGASYLLGDGVTIGAHFQILEDKDEAMTEEKIESFAGGVIVGFTF